MGKFNPLVTLEVGNLGIEDFVEDNGFIFHPKGVAAKVHSLAEQARKNNLDPRKLKLYLEIASATNGNPGNYQIVFDEIPYDVRIKGQVLHDGSIYGLLTRIARY